MLGGQGSIRERFYWERWSKVKVIKRCSCGTVMKKYQHVCSSCRTRVRRERRERHKLRKQLTDIMKDRARRDPIFEYFMERY